MALGLLIAASFVLTAINNIVDSIVTYPHSNRYTGVAGWLLALAIVAIVFHGIMIFFRILYVTSTIQNNYSGYAFAVSGNV